MTAKVVRDGWSTFAAALVRSEVDSSVWICHIPLTSHAETQAGGLRRMKNWVESNYTDRDFKYAWFHVGSDRWERHRNARAGASQ